MDKILEMLGITKLDEEKQTQLKAELEAIIEAKAAEKAKGLVEEEKEKVVEEMETKFEDYKEEITSKFSNFVDDILDEELVLPENIVEWARIGEEYSPLIESFKTKLAIDEGVLDNEVKGILREAKDEIIKITEEKDESTSKVLDLETENEKLMNENYLLKKMDGLTPKQKENVMAVLEGASKEEIDAKFNVLVKLNEEEEEFETVECPECGTENKAGSKKCKECGAELEGKDDDDDDDDDDKDKKKDDKKKDMKKESVTDLDDKDDKKLSLNEDGSLKNIWLKTLREGRI